MVYLHGGNFVHMSASSPVFRGEDFVMKGKVIYVSVDYRLGQYFELHPELLAFKHLWA